MFSNQSRKSTLIIAWASVLGLALSGCTSGSWWQAKTLSGADTRQAIELEESQDPKICVHVQGNGSAMGVDGFVEVIEARGQNVSFQDCLSAINKQMAPITLN